MSNPGLMKMLRGGGMQSFHVGGARAERAPGPVLFSGERFEFSAYQKSEGKPDFAKKENREEKGSKKRKKDGDDSDSGSESDSGPHYNKSGIHKKGSDADGDGKKNEGKSKKKLSFADKDKNGKVDAFEKK